MTLLLKKRKLPEPPEDLRLHTPSTDREQPFVMPDAIKELLEDATLGDEQKESIQMFSEVLGSFMSQALGGVYKRNLDGVPNWNQKRKTSASKAKFDAIRLRDPKAIRNDINVSHCSFSFGRVTQFSHLPRKRIGICFTSTLGFLKKRMSSNASKSIVMISRGLEQGKKIMKGLF